MQNVIDTNVKKGGQASDQAVGASITLLSSIVIAAGLAGANFFHPLLFLIVIPVIPFLSKGLYFFFGTHGLIARESQISADRCYPVIGTTSMMPAPGVMLEVVIFLDQKGRSRTVALEANSKFSITRFGQGKLLVPVDAYVVEEDGRPVLRRV